MQADRSDQVAADQDRPTAKAIHPYAGGQADQDERQELEEPKERNCSRAVTFRIGSPMSGTASRLTCVPNWLIVSADQSFGKSGLAQQAESPREAGWANRRSWARARASPLVGWR